MVSIALGSASLRGPSRPSTPRVIEMLGRSGSALRQGFRLRRKRLYAAGAVARWRSRDLPASIVSANHKKDAPRSGASFLAYSLSRWIFAAVISPPGTGYGQARDRRKNFPFTKPIFSCRINGNTRERGRTLSATISCICRRRRNSL